MLLKTRWSVEGHQKGKEIEHHLTAKAVLFYDNEANAFVPVRVIRLNQIRNVKSASPGALIAFEGHWNNNFEALEFHILKCSIIQNATFLPGDRVYERPDGTNRWYKPSFSHRDDVEETKTTFVWH